MQGRSRSTNASGPLRQAQRAGVKDRSRRAVTAMTARGAAREPGGAGRRHAHTDAPQPRSHEEATLVGIAHGVDLQLSQPGLDRSLAGKVLAAVLNPGAE